MRLASVIGLVKGEWVPVECGTDVQGMRNRFKEYSGTGKYGRKRYDQLYMYEREARRRIFTPKDAPSNFAGPESIAAYCAATGLDEGEIRGLLTRKRDPMPAGTVDEVKAWCDKQGIQPAPAPEPEEVEEETAGEPEGEAEETGAEDAAE